MKLAEALAERASLNEKIRSLKQRAQAAARYTEGEEPPESAAELLAQTRDAIGRQADLIARINITNTDVRLPSGPTMTEALAERARLGSEAKLLREIADHASPVRDSWRGRRRTELPEKTDLEVKDLHAQADRISQRHRELDAEIQRVNWSENLH